MQVFVVVLLERWSCIYDRTLGVYPSQEAADAAAVPFDAEDADPFAMVVETTLH